MKRKALQSYIILNESRNTKIPVYQEYSIKTMHDNDGLYKMAVKVNVENGNRSNEGNKETSMQIPNTNGEEILANFDISVIK